MNISSLGIGHCVYW